MACAPVFAPDAPTLIVLDKRTGRFLARDTAPTAANMLHGQWSSPSMGTVQGRKLVFLGGGDGNCYAFEALAGVPEDPVTLKTAWWVRLQSAGISFVRRDGHDGPLHARRQAAKDTINKLNDGSFVGMSEIIATPVFYKDRVYVAIGRDPDHGRGRGALLCLDADQTGDSTKTGQALDLPGTRPLAFHGVHRRRLALHCGRGRAVALPRRGDRQGVLGLRIQEPGDCLDDGGGRQDLPAQRKTSETSWLRGRR